MKKMLLVALAMLVLWPLDVEAMNQSAVPSKFNIPWGNGAGVPYIRNIPQASQIGIQNCAASLTDGFPPLTFTPSNAGGCPPFGADMNGILRQITQWEQWNAAGGPILYDAAFQTAIGGYPKSATLTNASTPGCFWISSIDANGTNPDTGGANWIKSCQSPWTISGNNIYNNNTANVGINTTSPSAIFDVEGPSAVYFNSAGGVAPLVGQIASGSAGTPITSTAPSVAITRQESITSDTENGKNPALYVESKGNNNTNGAQVNAFTAYATATGTGGDAVAVFGLSTQSTPSPNKHAAYGGFFAAFNTTQNASAVAVGTAAGNNSGGPLPLSTFLPTDVGSFGIDLVAGGTFTSTAAALIRSSSANWDVGIYIANVPNTYQMFGVGFNIDTGGNFNHTSDKNMKGSIKNISDGALDKVMALTPTTFTLNEDPKKRVYAGLIAQDIQPVMPEAISTDAKGHLVENDSSVVAYLVKAIQELKQQNDVLAAQIKALSK